MELLLSLRWVEEGESDILSSQFSGFLLFKGRLDIQGLHGGLDVVDRRQSRMADVQSFEHLREKIDVDDLAAGYLWNGNDDMFNLDLSQSRFMLASF